MITEADRLDAESRFAKVINDLKIIRPFYLAIYECMERVEDNSVVTVGVTSNKIVYNKDFVEDIKYNEFLFINLHEICHIGLMHVARACGKDITIWNIAADLYVNKVLAEEFNIEPGKESGRVKMPIGVLYCSSIDLDSECTEDIYNELMRQVKEHEKNLDTEEFEISYTGKKDDSDYGYGCSDKYKKFTTKIRINYALDVSDRYESTNKELIKDIKGDKSKSPQEIEDSNKDTLSKASVKYDMLKGRMVGSNSSKLEAIVSNLLHSHVDWKKLLRKYCIQASSKDTSFARPDRRMYYQSAIYPGQDVYESNKIKGVKLCFDSSGSISETDMAYYLGQVRDLMKKFKIESEVIYWDTSIETADIADDFKDVMKAKILGRGGTDVAVVFNYLDSKKCKVKPIVTIVFTDGYVLEDWEKDIWTRKYKDTIWVMTKDFNKEFKPKFGIVTEARYSS